MVVLIYRSLTELLGADQAFDAMVGSMTMHGYGILDQVFRYSRIWDHYPTGTLTGD